MIGDRGICAEGRVTGETVALLTLAKGRKRSDGKTSTKGLRKHRRLMKSISRRGVPLDERPTCNCPKTS